MRTLMRKINRRAGAELITSERIQKLSSKSMRVTMATRLYRAGVPMPEIVDMGEWEDEAMARTYIRTLQAFAGERRNLSYVSARKRKASTSDEGQSDSQATQALVATDGVVAQLVAVATSQALGRSKEMAVCCPDKYVAQGGCVVRTENLEKDAALKQLWEEVEGLPSGKVRKLLCDKEYHCSCKQIQNCRSRLKERQKHCLKPRRLELMEA